MEITKQRNWLLVIKFFIIFHFIYSLMCSMWIQAKNAEINTLNVQLTVSAEYCHDLQNLIDEKEDVIVKVADA